MAEKALTAVIQEAYVQGIARVPAAEIEAAVIGHIRGLLRSPEVVMSTWRAAQQECEGLTEDEVRGELAALDLL